MWYIILTNHVIEKVKERTTRITDNTAKHFIINIYKRLRDRSIKWKTNKGREVKYKYIGKQRYYLSDWKHKIVFKKDNGEDIILTYINQEQKDQTYSMKDLMHNIWILGSKV